MFKAKGTGSLALERRIGETILATLPTDPEELLKLAGQRLTIQVSAHLDNPPRTVLALNFPRSIQILRDDAHQRRDVSR